MQGKSLYLVIGAVAAAAIAFFVAQSRAPQTELATDQALVPGLADALNDVTRIVVTGAGGETKVALSKGDTQWSVDQRGGYRADPAAIRTFLIDLGDAQLIEQKTARAENYPTLGVEDIDVADAGGVSVALEGAGDMAPVIIGKPARGTASVYVRRAGDATSWVANKRLRVERDPAKWLVKDLLDINAARVASIRVEHADGEVFEATRGAAGFDVANLPDGATLESPTAANELAEVFDDLKFEDVTPLADFDAGDAPKTVTTYSTTDGLKLTATTVATDGKYYMMAMTEPFTVNPDRFDEAQSDEEDAAAPAGESAAGGSTDPSPEEKVAAMFDAMTSQSTDLNERLEGWVFTIPLFKYELLNRRVADYLAADEDEVGPN